ncbi:Abhydrolase 3 domain-containing protein [Citrus sinensis]|uniref:Abhydrolase 3 domain-containing protein n=1 Tax=Citrus sinensis TaxID=2711 RepID=A0ACB8LEN0_CITSI|nr:Abhydrolase 3 domain-containing protein [Citrus sinensis]
MAATIDPSLSGLEMHKNLNPQGAVIDEIEGLIRVYKDGRVERLPIVPSVTCALAPDMGVTSRDIVLDKFTNIWARFYVPILCQSTKLPLVVYFHGGGFCVGSAAWSCYHEFLATLAKKAGCIIMSVNYRLAPENPLPAAYEDGFTSLMWLKQQATSSCGGSVDWLSRQCNFSSIFLAGDSAGANIAHNVALRLGNSNNKVATLKPLTFKGTILIQPFFGGEARTNSEKYLAQPPRSALSLAASDTYWRLALPRGSNRDHPWSNPMSKGSTELEQYCGLLPLPTLVCISEMDILKDRNLEFCSALGRTDKRVEHVMYKGVGHAFQILSIFKTREKKQRYEFEQARENEDISGHGTVKWHRPEDAKSIGCGYGACSDDTMEFVLFVLRSDGVGGNGGGSQRLMEMRLNNGVLLLLAVLLNWTTVAFLFPFYRVETMLFFMTILLL